MGLTYAIFIVNLIFRNFLLENIFWKYFLLFFTDFKLLMFCNNIVKVLEILNKLNIENLHPNYLPYQYL